MTDIKSMTIDELKKLMTTLGDKPFRAKQIYSWLHEHLVTSYDEMTNLSKSLREKLKEYPVTALKMVDVQTSRIDGTQKYLFRLSDGNVIESVLMRYKHGNSVCISSQVLFKSRTFAASHTVSETQKMVEEAIEDAPGLRLEYFEIVDGNTLQKVSSWEDSLYVVGCITVFCGEVRLIDNIKYKEI